jgi:hypothetical protein
MASKAQEASAIAHFALACERMNDFERSMRNSAIYDAVRSGADIRHYKSGWRLEKWVEAELDGGEGIWAVWWMELECRDGTWIVESHVGVSPSEFSFDFTDRLASSAEELGRQLTAVVDELMGALTHNPEFSQAVRRWKPN